MLCSRISHLACTQVMSYMLDLGVDRYVISQGSVRWDERLIRKMFKCVGNQTNDGGLKRMEEHDWI